MSTMRRGAEQPEELRIRFGEEDVTGHAGIRFDSPQDEDRFKERIAGERAVQVRVRLADEVDDTSGHAFGATTVRAVLAGPDEDDTEGHAIELHFPSAQEARDFRNRLVVAGALFATVAAGGLAAPVVMDALGGAGAGAAAPNAAVTDEGGDRIDRPTDPSIR